MIPPDESSQASGRRPASAWNLLAVALAAFFLGGFAALLPSMQKGAGPRLALDNLIAARALAQTGIPSIEDGAQGIALSTGELSERVARGAPPPATTAGNRLTYRVYAAAMKLFPTLERNPQMLAALFGALAAFAIVYATGRLGGFAAAWMALALYITMPIVWISTSSPAHVDFAFALMAFAFAIALGRRTPSLAALIAAGICAGLAALARDSYVVGAMILALAVIGWRDSNAALIHRARLHAIARGALIGALALLVFWIGGGFDSEYADRAQRGAEYHRLGHAFPDMVVYREYMAATPAERASNPVLAELDQREASMYAGLGDPSPGGAVAKLIARATKSLPFYTREFMALDGFGGPLILLLILAGLVHETCRQGRGALLHALALGAPLFLAFHAIIGTSNESHLSVLAAPAVIAAAIGLAEIARVAAARAPARWRLLIFTLIFLAVAGQSVLAARVGMSRLYNGAGAARHGTSDTLELAHIVAAIPVDADHPRVMVGSRGEDVLAVAYFADRSAFALAPATLARLANAGELTALLEEMQVGIAVGYPQAHLEMIKGALPVDQPVHLIEISTR